MKSSSGLLSEIDLSRAILETIGALVVILDKEGKIVLFNPTCQNVSGFSEQEALGKTPWEFLLPMDVREAVRDVFNSLTAGHFPNEYENAWLTKDGNQRQIAWSNTALCSEDGTVSFVIATGIDITEFRKTQTEAESANRAKSDFLAMMSHELRTPLNAIIGYSEMLGTGVFGELVNKKHVEYVEDIKNSGEHLLHLINDILDLSKIEAKKEEIFERRIDVQKMLDTCLNRIRHFAEKRDINLDADWSDSLPDLMGDERRLVQVFLNLLSNAAKFTEEGGKVTFSCAVEDDKGMVFRVIDTGMGIAEKDLDKVIMPFEQIGEVAVTPQDGTGLGLAISKSLVELHDGEFVVESELGKGTTVTVRMPAERIVSAS